MIPPATGATLPSVVDYYRQHRQWVSGYESWERRKRPKVPTHWPTALPTQSIAWQVDETSPDYRRW